MLLSEIHYLLITENAIGEKMIRKSIVSTFVFLMSSIAFAEVQTVTSVPSSFNVSVGENVEFTVKYPSTNPADATGLGLKIFYDSSKLGSATVTNILQDNLLIQSTDDDTSDLDGDNTTDKFINIAWASFSGAWSALGKDIVTVSFTTSAGFTSDTLISFTGKAATGHTFTANPISVSLKN